MKLNLKTIMLLLVSILLFTSSSGQQVQVLFENTDFTAPDGVNDFHYIDKKTDLSGIIKIATLKGTYNKAENLSINYLFNSFFAKSGDYKANSFRIDKVVNDSNEVIEVIVSIYYLTKEQVETNFNTYPKNTVYVFGNMDPSKIKYRSFKLNGNKIKLKPCHYVFYQNEPGKEATVSVGGMFGAKRWIRGKEGRLPTHLSLSGLKVREGYSAQVGVGLTTGSIYSVDLNFGQFLVDVLMKQEY